jgi:hypothetical protein
MLSASASLQLLRRRAVGSSTSVALTPLRARVASRRVATDAALSPITVRLLPVQAAAVALKRRRERHRQSVAELWRQRCAAQVREFPRCLATSAVSG